MGKVEIDDVADARLTDAAEDMLLALQACVQRLACNADHFSAIGLKDEAAANRVLVNSCMGVIDQALNG
ncbi:MAG: hypothetical protein IPH35_04600 [Rhodoferax sp.]|nr:hypothetical protein [Rhodoferax sp.]